jgi:hypothetical protein
MTRRFIGYPTGWLLAVIDDPTAAADAARELAAADVGETDLMLLTGSSGAQGLDGLGTSSGFIARAWRAVQFATMDQMPDFLLDERAAEEGRTVVGVRTSATIDRDQLLDILRAHGAHFINRFGSLMTEEIAEWVGERPTVPYYMQR